MFCSVLFFLSIKLQAQDPFIDAQDIEVFEPREFKRQIGLMAWASNYDYSENYAFGFEYHFKKDYAWLVNFSPAIVRLPNTVDYSNGFYLQTSLNYFPITDEYAAPNKGLFLGLYANSLNLNTGGALSFGGYQPVYVQGFLIGFDPILYTKSYFGFSMGLNLGYSLPLGKSFRIGAIAQAGYFLIHEEIYSSPPEPKFDFRPELNRYDFRLALSLSYLIELRN